MSIFTRLSQKIDKRTLVVAMITPVALFLVLEEFSDWIWKYDSPVNTFMVLTLLEHYYIGHYVGLDWTFIDTSGGFPSLPISPPVFLLAGLLNYVAVVVVFYLILRIAIRIQSARQGVAPTEL